MKIEFDLTREMTLYETILCQKMVRDQDWESFIEFVRLRSIDPPKREDLLILPMSEVIKLINDLGEVIKQVSNVSHLMKLNS